jgi:tetratricopeptide (TPR) repeat protein
MSHFKKMFYAECDIVKVPAQQALIYNRTVRRSIGSRASARAVLISFVLLLLVLAPRPLAGYLELRRAQSLESTGKHEAAASALAAAAERLPWQPSLWEKAGMEAWLGVDHANALIYLKQAAGRKAISQAGWLMLGNTYQDSGDLPSALDAWSHALPLAEAYRHLAQVQRQMGNFQAARVSLQADLQANPQDAEAHYALGLLEMAAAPQDALPQLMQAVQDDPALDKTVQSLRSVLNTALLSDDPAYRLVLSGRALGAVGGWDLAAEAFRNAITARPDYAEAWAWLGEAEQQQGQTGKNELEKALALNPDSAMTQSLYGLYLQRQKQPKQALEAFLKAAALEPEEPAWQMALGSAYEQTGDLVVALEHYQRAADLAPEAANVWQALAAFSLRNGVDLAGVGLPAARKLVELANDDWQSVDLAGQILLGLDDSTGAEVLLKKALELAPLQAAPSLHLGLLYLQTENRAAAYSYLNQAKAFDPDGPAGLQAKRLLEQYFP